MATTGIINGTLMRLYKDSTAIGYATSCQMNVSAAMREILTKDSAAGGWREVILLRMVLPVPLHFVAPGQHGRSQRQRQQHD